jgi:hypothetical protein
MGPYGDPISDLMNAQNTHTFLHTVGIRYID